jgi:ureidoglycolate dehydrogenase (NAD+)
MSLAFELLTGALANNPIVAEFHDGTPGGRRHRQNATLIAVDVSAFLELEQFTRIVDRTIAAISALPAAGEAPVTTPGQRSAATAAQRECGGIPVPPKVWASVTEAAQRLGVAVPQVAAA